MATEQLQEYAEWRAIQKERERERRRMRDRQRRQSMSVEEREKHLARRRRNYQLRRQRAANAQLGLQQQPNLETETAAEPSITNNSLPLVCVPELSVQSDSAVFAPSDANRVQNSSALKYDSETVLPGPYKYPQLLRLSQIKHLARLLNSTAEKFLVASEEMGADAINGEMGAPKGISRKAIRLVHLKHLIRMLNSKMGTTCEQNDSDTEQGGENHIMEIEIEKSDKALMDRRTIDAIDEEEEIGTNNI